MTDLFGFLGVVFCLIILSLVVLFTASYLPRPLRGLVDDD